MELKTLKEWYEFNKPYLQAGCNIEFYLYKKIVTKPVIEFEESIFTIDVLNYSNRMESIVNTFGSWIIGKVRSDLALIKICIVDPENVKVCEKQIGDNVVPLA